MRLAGKLRVSRSWAVEATGFRALGQDHVLALRMQASVGRVLLGPPAGEQERNQGDAEAVFKQLDDVGCLPEAASLNRATQSLAGLLPEGLKQPVQTELQQSLTWGDAPGTVKTARQTLFADPKPPRQLRHRQGLAKMQGEEPERLPTRRRQSLKVFSDSSPAGPVAPQALTAATSRVRAGADGAEGSVFRRDTASPHQLQPFCPRCLLMAGQARGQRQNRLMRVAIKGNICSENDTCPGEMFRTDGLDPASPSMVSLEQRQRCSCRLAKGDQASLTRRFLVLSPLVLSQAGLRARAAQTFDQMQSRLPSPRKLTDGSAEQDPYRLQPDGWCNKGIKKVADRAAPAARG